MPVGMVTRSKKLLQLLRGPVHDALLAIEGAQGPIIGREGESSRLPDNEPMTGTLEHRASHSADRLVVKGETREGGYRERSAKEKTDERRSPQQGRVADC